MARKAADRDTALAFADRVWMDFERVVWVDSLERSPAGVLGDIAWLIGAVCGRSASTIRSRAAQSLANRIASAWGVIMLFNLVTLPVEFDASRRAKAVLAHFGYIAPGEEALGVKKVLDAAAWTYVAAFVTSLAYFLWHLLPLLAGHRSRD